MVDTARDADNQIYFTDDGKFVFGNENDNYVEDNGNINEGFSFVNKANWEYEDTESNLVGLYGGQLSAINLKPSRGNG